MDCIFCENKKRMTKFEIQNKQYSLNIKKLPIFWIFILIICVKNQNKDSILNFNFQFIKKT